MYIEYNILRNVRMVYRWSDAEDAGCKQQAWYISLVRWRMTSLINLKDLHWIWINKWTSVFDNGVCLRKAHNNDRILEMTLIDDCTP